MNSEAVLAALEGVYVAIFQIFPKQGTFKEIRSSETFHEYTSKISGADELREMFISILDPEQKEMARNFFDLSTFQERLKDRDRMSTYLHSALSGWVKLILIPTEYSVETGVESMLLCIKDVNSKRSKEISTRDALALNANAVEALSAEYTNVYMVDTKERAVYILKLEGRNVPGLVKDYMGPYPYGDSLDSYIKERVYDEDKEYLQHALNLETVMEELSDKDVYSGTYRAIFGDKPVHFEFKFKRARSANSIVCGFQNVEAMFERERKRNAHLQELKNIIAASEMGTWHIELFDGVEPRIVCDDYMKVLLGVDKLNLTPEETYKFWMSRIPEEFLPSVYNSVAIMKSGRKDENTYGYEHPSLGLRYVRCGGTAVELPGKGYVLSGYHYDITDEFVKAKAADETLKKALADSENANKAKTIFLNNMSHDIRTPMNAIIGFNALASSHVDDPELVKSYLSKISAASSHLLNLINAVLDMSKIESGTLSITESQVQIPSMLSDIDDIIRVNIEAKHLNFTLDATGIVHDCAYVDKLRLNQVLLNILSNAVKFTNPGGNISLKVVETECRKEGFANYNFTITDSGIGIGPDFLAHIFEPFSREHTTTVSGIQGTGLGMAITKRLVDMMGGTIGANSERGKGTSFFLTLPCKICYGCPSSPAAIVDKEKEVSIKGMRILLAEDNELNQEITSAILEEYGAEIECVNDGTLAVDKVINNPAGYYGLILMDVQMPVMNGYEASTTIRNLNDSMKASIPIIALTANAFAEDRLNAFEAGMNAHLAKPIEIDALVKTIKNIYSKK